MNIEAAISEIREHMAALVADMKARGHHNATADIRIFGSKFVIDIDTHGAKAFRHRKFGGPDSWAWVHGGEKSYSEALQEAQRFIGGMDVTPEISCAAWFEMPAIADAAE